VFLDRDGVINVKQPDGQYVCDWSQFAIIPSIVDWIRLFNALGYLVVVITNQRGVARGKLTIETLQQIHAQMIETLGQRGAHIDGVLFCPHEIDACNCRKPRTGMITSACKQWDIDLTKSLMIGDSDSDRELAENCGLHFIRVRDGVITDVSASLVRDQP
jgi:D-glycero-D-manno-heptose 1,7-bisphosphate phosphatase